MSQYLRALMQKKLVCKSEEERSQFSHRLLQDATQLGDLFHSLVREVAPLPSHIPSKLVSNMGWHLKGEDRAAG